MTSRARARKTWDGPTEDEDLCSLHTERGVEELRGSSTESGGSLPVRDVRDVPLVLTEPCWLRTANRVFRVEEEGFYRFSVFPETTHQRILYRGNLPRFIGAIGQLHLHGWRDNGRPMQELLAKAEGQFVSITCGYIREVARELLAAQGVEARRVSTLTLDRWNTYNCGHALVEYRDPVEKRWILGDPDVGVMFRAEGSWLDTETVCRRVRGGLGWEIVELSSGMNLDLCTDNTDRRTAFYALTMSAFPHPVQRKRFFDRVFQVAQLGDDYTVDTEEERVRFDAVCATQNLRYNYLTLAEFRDRYYP